MDKFAALKAYATVVEKGGFAAAARELGRSRSAINRLVIALETGLGAQLLNRTTRSVSPTAQGAAFYERTQAILATLAEAESDLAKTRREVTGLLRINAPMSFGTLCVGPIVAEFMALHPKLRVELHLNDRIVDIVEEGFDLAIRITQPREDTTLVDFRLCEIDGVICAAPAYVAAYGAPNHPRELRTRHCLHYGNLPTGDLWRLLNTDGTSIGVHVNAVLWSNNGQALRDAAVRGLGIALMPRFIADAELEAGRLVTVLDDFRVPTAVLAVVYPPTRFLTAKIRLFTDFLIERFDPAQRDA
jgi:DNA-binding transcriptional LysR family regulator